MKFFTCVYSLVISYIIVMMFVILNKMQKLYELKHKNITSTPVTDSPLSLAAMVAVMSVALLVGMITL